MPRMFDPIQFVLIALAGWMNERQQQTIEYLRTYVSSQHDRCCSVVSRIEPAPERSRSTTRREFVDRHWELIVAAEFFTVEVETAKGEALPGPVLY
jgi:hypothetical protein